MNEITEPYNTLDFDCADLLWDYLSPTKLNNRGEFSYLKFRGHASADWRLIPTGLRNTFSASHFLLTPPKTISDIIANEISVLFNFATYCDKVGIPIPNDSTSFRSRSLKLTSNENGKYLSLPSLWPNPEIYEILAMAQHHGVPTRLLDWSESPYVAAYFAASGAISNYQQDDWTTQKLAIWMVRNCNQPNSDKLRFINVPGSVSKHLPAQMGCFSIHPIFAYEGDVNDATGLEQYDFTSDGFEFTKLTLPTSESVRLLHLCTSIGFSAADLFPSADGAGRAVKEQMKVNAASRFLNLKFDGTK